MWAAVFKCEEAKTDAKLRNYFHHLRIVQRAFLRTWRGEPLDAPFPEFDETLALMRWGQSYYAEAHNFLATLTSAETAQSLPVEWSEMIERLIGRAPATTTLSDTLHQVALHSLYHRGQINARLREIGGQPPLVDFIAWVWFGRPPAEWPLVESEDTAK